MPQQRSPVATFEDLNLYYKVETIGTQITLYTKKRVTNSWKKHEIVRKA